jgi:phage terminase large subunit GpA-like protein
VRVFARKWAHSRRVIAVKGQAVAGKALIGRPTKQDVNHRGQIIKHGVELWPYGSDTAKGALYARLKIEEAGPGYVHLPSGLPDEVFDQLTAERRVTRYIRGHPRTEWVLQKGKRNEALDCAGMAHAAAEYAGLSRVNWDQLEQVINPTQRDIFAAPVKHSATEEAGEEQSPASPPVQTSAPDEQPAASGFFNVPRRRVRHAGIKR